MGNVEKHSIVTAKVAMCGNDMDVEFTDCALSPMDTKNLVLDAISAVCNISNSIHFLEGGEAYDPDYEYALYCWNDDKETENQREQRDYPTIGLAVNPTVLEKNLRCDDDWVVIRFHEYAPNAYGLKEIADFLRILADQNGYDFRASEEYLVAHGITQQDAETASTVLRHGWRFVADKLTQMLELKRE